MPVVGSFASLRALRRQVAAITSPRFSDGLGKVLGEAARKLVADGFQNQIDPYGSAWEPLKHRAGRILQRSGRLKRSFTYGPAPGGFKISTNVVYAGAHQDGAKIKRTVRSERNLKRKSKSGAQASGVVVIVIPRRMMIPIKDRGLGQRWRPPLALAADKWIAKWFEAVRGGKGKP